MMKTENVILAAGATQTLNTAGKWFRVRELRGGSDPYVTIKALSTDGSKQLADGLDAYDGDSFGWDDSSFRDLTFTNPNAVEVTFDVLISDQGRHDVSRPAVAIVGSVPAPTEWEGGTVPVPAGTVVDGGPGYDGLIAFTLIHCAASAALPVLVHQRSKADAFVLLHGVPVYPGETKKFEYFNNVKIANPNAADVDVGIWNFGNTFPL